MGKISKKFISLILASLMFVFSVSSTSVLAENINNSDTINIAVGGKNYIINKEVADNEQIFNVKADNVNYQINKTVLDNQIRLEITKSDSPEDLVVLTLNNDTVKATKNIYNGIDNQGNMQYTKTNFELEREIHASGAGVSPLTITWGDTVYEKLHNKYAYSVGSDLGQTYCKVICDSTTNRIRTDNLTSTNRSNYNGYISSIKSCNSSTSTAELYLGTGFISVGVVLIATGIIAPAALVAALIAAGVTGTGSSVLAGANALLKANSEYENIKDYYILIKDLSMF